MKDLVSLNYQITRSLVTLMRDCTSKLKKTDRGVDSKSGPSWGPDQFRSKERRNTVVGTSVYTNVFWFLSAGENYV